MASGTDDALITALIDEMSRAYRERDLTALMACLARSADVTALGTSIDEKCIGRDAVEAQFVRDWEQYDEASFVPGWTSVTVRGDVAWAVSDMDLAFRAGDASGAMAGRSTIIAVREDDSWRVAHWHLSAPAPQDEEESSTADTR